MAESKHSKGKWRVRIGEYPRGHPNQIVISNPSRCICKIHQPKREKAFADALLIAASPDMLEYIDAVEQWEAQMLVDEDAWRNSLPVFTQDLYDLWMLLQEQRNNVLAKAKGESNG